MLKKLLLNLQLFGEGGDGGDGGSANPTGESVSGNSGEDLIPASIPEKAKKYYQKAVAKSTKQNVDNNKSSEPQVQTTDAPEVAEKQKLSYADLIKSDDYKDEHKAYMDKTIGDRLKKYKGMEDNYSKAISTLEIVANKYGVNPTDENFLETLNQKIEADDSYYENYAMEHDISAEEARKIVTMERKVAQIEAEKQERAKQEAMRQQLIILHQNAEKTKAQFPEFDLNTEMQDERFRKLCAVNNGDTTSAYMACHWKELTTNMVQMKTKEIQSQTAQAVASNKSRPIENGLSSVAPSVTTQNFSGMSLAELRAYADEQRRKGR